MEIEINLIANSRKRKDQILIWAFDPKNEYKAKKALKYLMLVFGGIGFHILGETGERREEEEEEEEKRRKKIRRSKVWILVWSLYRIGCMDISFSFSRV